MDLNDILNSLSAEDIKQLKETARGLLGEDNRSKPISEPSSSNDLSLLFSDPQSLQKMMKITKMISSADDRIRFFSCIKPLLSERRQKKADAAIMILQMLRIQEALRKEEGEIGNHD